MKTLKKRLLFFTILIALTIVWGCKKDKDSGKVEKLIFMSDRTSDYDLYMMDIDGKNLKNLTNMPNSNEYHGTLSPDGHKLLLASETAGKQTIYVLNAGSAQPTKLIESDGNNYAPVWSPDGTKFAFISTRDQNEEIYISLSTKPDSLGTVKRLTNSVEIDDEVTWSPDGSRLAFVSGRDGNKEIYIMNADGSKQTNITNDVGEDTDPSWSPDGKHIVFVSIRQQFKGIYVIDLDSLTAPAKLITGAIGNDSYNPVWSPDGKSIAFVSNRDGNEEIYVINADKTGEKRLTYLNGSDHNPRWSVDGQKIVFASQSGNNYEIAIVSRDGGVITKFASYNCIDDDVTWVKIDEEINW